MSHPSSPLAGLLAGATGALTILASASLAGAIYPGAHWRGAALAFVAAPAILLGAYAALKEMRRPRVKVDAAESRVDKWKRDYTPRGRRMYATALRALAGALAEWERADPTPNPAPPGAKESK